MHGTWGTLDDTWSEFKPFVDGDNYLVTLADYSQPPYSNVGSLIQNYPAISDAIRKALDSAISTKLAATKVDIIAHSLGGLVTREFCVRAPLSCSDSIRKIITLDSTHLGTEMADVFLKHKGLIEFVQFFIDVAKVFGVSIQDIDGDALKDQAPNSDALTVLAQNPPPVPMHKIVGKTQDNVFGYVHKTKRLWKILQRWFNLVPDISFPSSETTVAPLGQSRTIVYTPVFPSENDPDLGRNDRIVSMRSQKNGSSLNTTVFENVDHTTIHGDKEVQITSAIVDCVNQLLDAKDIDPIWANGCK